MATIFALIRIILAAFKLWDQFGDYVEAERTLEREAKRKAREEALKDSVVAETDEEIWDAQERIVDNKP